MSKNTFGNVLRVTSFGESHGAGLGCVIDGCPAGVIFDLKEVQTALDRRRPNSQSYALQGMVSERNEADQVEVLSGVFEGKTLGTPIAFLVRNKDQRSEDYQQVKDNPRPGHADDMWKGKFLHADYRGGGRSSGRETLSRVIAGAVAKMVVHQLQPGVDVIGFTESVAQFQLSAEDLVSVRRGINNPEDFKMRFPSDAHTALAKMISEAKVNGQSYGGTAGFFIKYIPAFLGQPVAHKFKADLAAAVLSLGAVNSFELGDVKLSNTMEGSEFHKKEFLDSTLKYGGVRGGLTTGDDVYFRASFKPTSTVMDLAKKGRHDPCIIPRAIPVIESMLWLIIADHVLWSRMDRI